MVQVLLVIFVGFLLFPNSLHAKSVAIGSPPLAPGELQSTSGGIRISLEEGRSLEWPKQGPLVLLDREGKPLVQVDLGQKGRKESGAEALGITVEETDLGGSISSKGYLKGKKKPRGRSFDAGALGGEGLGQGQKEEKTVDGIVITTLSYPNGVSELSFAWPGEKETLTFDRRKSLIVAERSRKVDSLNYQLKQWSEGSYARSYQGDRGSFHSTYDTNDESYLLEFFNPQGEIVAQLNCKGSCAPSE